MDLSFDVVAEMRECRHCLTHLDECLVDLTFLTVVSAHTVMLRIGAAEVIARYLIGHHQTGHPSQSERLDIGRQYNEQQLPGSAVKPHVFEPMDNGTDDGIIFCRHGALRGAENFCGQLAGNKVHSFLCPQCERRSHHPMDVHSGYCGHCHAFTGVRVD